ncbi:MAG TPA: glycogen-binding domain-containing protein [Gemmatimonadaceae bacterium]|nr:glycogen-binding domain-containing protein [Gemmatimonadaceae bacterium]
MTVGATRLARIACTLLFAPTVMWAQRVSSSIDVGGSSMRYADSISSSGPSISPSFSLDWARTSLDATGTYSHLGGGSSTQGTVSGSFFTPSAGVLLGEFFGSAGGSAHQDGARTGQTLALARAHAMSASGGAWVGGGAGRTWDGSTWRTVLASEAGAWLSKRGLSVVGSVAPTQVADTIRYVDTQLSTRWVSPKLELGASVGVRGGAHSAALGGTGSNWGSVALVTWLVPQMGIVLDAGTYPVDLTQGFPGGRFASLSLRLRTSPARTDRSVAQDDPASAPGVSSFSLEPGSSGQTIRVRAPNARNVEIMGDFTQWRPVALERDGEGSWLLGVRIGPGTHQINVRVDGGPWMVPPSLPAITDEFGGSVGLLVVR